MLKKTVLIQKFDINKFMIMLSHIFSFRSAIIFGLIFLLTSCFYSTKYLATYTIQDKNSVSFTKDLSFSFIEKIALNNELSKDPKYFGTDTLGFFGQPYHYFKFWIVQYEPQSIINLDYYGVFGSRRNPPYRFLLNSLTDSVRTNFNLIDKDIKDENNMKKN